MQLRLLNIYKLLANIATNLVGAFIPLIVYNETGVMLYAIVALVLQYVVRIATNFLLKKLYYTKPQLCLMYRIIPIALYSTFIILMDVNVWVGIIGSCVFYGINNSLKSLPPEIIYNYSSQEDSGGKLGLSRLFEQVGTIAAFVVGGFMLDVNKIVITVISLVIYVIAVIPLFMYYKRSKNDKLFNKEFTSNAYETMKKNAEAKDKGTKLARKITAGYALVYFLYSFLDVFSNAFNLYIMQASSASLSAVGIYSAVYNATYGIGSYIAGKINDRKDTTWMVSISAVLLAVCVAIIPVVHGDIAYYIIFGAVGLFYSPIPIFALQRLLAKTRILGVSNEALFIRENVTNLSVILPIMTGMFGTMIPVFAVISGALAVSTFLIPYNEERTRKLLVNYLQHNEIVYERRRLRQAKKHADKKEQTNKQSESKKEVSKKVTENKK